MSSFTRPLIVEVPDKGNDIVAEPFHFWRGDDEATGEHITVPKGFRTDYASVPRVLRSFLSPKKKIAKPAVIHDYLYSTGSVSKKEADTIFLEAMKVNKVNPIKRFVYYQAVNIFGFWAWRKSRKRQEKGD